MISLIACMDLENGIGINNQLPWHLPEDLLHFKKTTEGHPIVMGRKTFQSIGKPLPNRSNIILTTEQRFHTPQSCFLYNSIEEFLTSYWNQEDKEIFVIGGSSIYQQFLPYADRLYLTKIAHTFECDAFFPTIHWDNWIEIDKKEGLHCKDYEYTFYTYERSHKIGKSCVEKQAIVHDIDGNEVVGTIIYSRKAIYKEPSVKK